MITTTSANDQQLRDANENPDMTCVNCKKDLEFVI